MIGFNQSAAVMKTLDHIINKRFILAKLIKELEVQKDVLLIPYNSSMLHLLRLRRGEKEPWYAERAERKSSWFGPSKDDKKSTE